MGLQREVETPNITGGMTMYRGTSGDGEYGAFQRSTGDSMNYTMMKTDSPVYNAVIDFSASASNTIYSGSSVQAPSLQALACIKF